MLALSALAVFLGSALLFSVQPLVGKRLLPLLGGTPGVWNACMLFFQAVLLGGYLWAHRVTRRGGVAPGLPWHAGLLVVAAGSLPLGLPDGRVPAAGDEPALWLLVTLALMVGLPAVALAGTAPLVQSWFASSAHHRARDPYFLYAASNLGSAVALIGYPLLVEPRMSHALQELAWSWLYALFVLVMVVLGVATRRAPGTPLPRAADAPPTTPRERRDWLLLSALPAALVLAATQHVTTDIASLPLLWIVPLACYLATCVVAFSRHGAAATRLAERVAGPAVLVAVLLVVFAERGAVLLQLGVHLAALTAVAQLSHGRLAARRPPADRLTSFYFWLALGGVLGGAFVSLAAPLVFDRFYEYPLLLAGGCLLLPGAFDRPRAATAWRDAAAPGAGLAVVIAAGLWMPPLGDGPEPGAMPLTRWVTLALACVAVLGVTRRGRGLALAVLALYVTPMPTETRGERLQRTRTFFGVYEVWEDETPAGRFRLLVHGTTTHGVQGTGPLAALPTAYYAPEGPMGDMLRAISHDGARPLDVAVLGLGAGAMALHARPGWSMTFHEIDPEVARLAGDADLFTCLELSDADISIVLGDGRLQLAASDATYDVIVLDAFGSDAVPVHLLTVEAMQTWLAHLRPGGALMFNVSNDYLALAQVLAAAAEDLGLACLGTIHAAMTPEQNAHLVYPSAWVMIVRSRDELDASLFRLGWGWLTPEDHVRAWTDDFSSLLSVLR